MNFLVLLVTFYIVKHAVSCKPEYYFEICEIYCLKLNFHETCNPLKQTQNTHIPELKEMGSKTIRVADIANYLIFRLIGELH